MSYSVNGNYSTYTGYTPYTSYKNNYIDMKQQLLGNALTVKKSVESLFAQPYQTKKQGVDLFDKLSMLTSKSSLSAANKTIAHSSNSDISSIDSNKAYGLTGAKGFSIKVDKVAMEQVNSNTDLKLKSTGKEVEASNNAYKFEIQASGKTHSFSIDVRSSDNNKTIQEKMAQVINKADIGVKANTTTKDGISSISVSSKETGLNISGDFKITDTSGNLAEKMGITTKSQSAQDAEYRIGNAKGTEFGNVIKSSSNNISLNNGLKATLVNSSDTATTVSFAKDPNAAIQAAVGFVKSLNEALSQAKETKGRGTDRLLSDINGMNKNYAQSLSRVGISVGNDGSLSVNANKLKESAEKGTLQSMFQDNRGYAKRAATIASNMKSGTYYSNPVNNSYSMNNLLSGYGDSYSMYNFLF